MQKGRKAENESQSLHHPWAMWPPHSKAQGGNSTGNRRMEVTTLLQYPTDYVSLGGRQHLLIFLFYSVVKKTNIEKN